MEVWKPVVGFENLYQVSDFGRVKRIPLKFKIVGVKNRRETMLRPEINKWGYAAVSLSYGKVKKMKTVHRVLMEAHVPNPENKRCINHLDGNKLNNNIDNLEWCTHSENSMHASRMGKMRGNQSQLGMINEKSKLSKPIVQLEISGSFVKFWPSIAEARRSGFCPATIVRCLKGRRPHACGYLWKYKNALING